MTHQELQKLLSIAKAMSPSEEIQFELKQGESLPSKFPPIRVVRYSPDLNKTCAITAEDVISWCKAFNITLDN